VYDVSGDGNHATLVNGTVANIWATRLSGTVKDHCIEYGGDIAANGAFIPALLDSSLAADGTAITLAAGQAMNPYSRRNLNPFTAAEFNGRSVPTSIGPRTDVSLLVTPTDSAFNRSSATQDDRIAIFSEALTGATLTSMQTYAPFTLTPNAYAIKIKTDNGGTSSSTQFTFPATGTYTISWGDGTVETLTGAQTHTYPAAGTYVVQVTGGLTAVTFNNGGDRLKLLEIMQWGSIAWTTMANSYYGCSNMQGTFTDAPNLSAVTTMSSMFRGATSFNQPIGSWDVSAVTSMVNFMLSKTAADYSASHLDAIYNQWSLLTLQPSLSISFGTIKYTAAGSAGRAVLTGAPNSWTIVDGGI
jgi:surface protein